MYGNWGIDTVVSRDGQWDYLRGGIGADACYEDSVARGDGFADNAAGFDTILKKAP